MTKKEVIKGFELLSESAGEVKQPLLGMSLDQETGEAMLIVCGSTKELVDMYINIGLKLIDGINIPELPLMLMVALNER